MKRNLIFNLLLCSALALFSCEKGQEAGLSSTSNGGTPSNTITLGEARDKLEDILRDINQQGGEESEFSGKVVEEAFTLGGGNVLTRAGDTDSSLIYVFNFADNGGFAIMSGRVGLPSLLALSYSGRFTETSVEENPGLEIFMSGIQTMSKLRGDDDSPQLNGRFSLIDEYTEEIVYKPGGYCSVTWGQGTPYNNCCPACDSAEHAVAGCVAVAVAQLMSIYKHPASYDGYGFDWDEMTAEPTAEDGTPAADQIASLMALLGEKKNLNATYGAKSTSASSSYIPRTLENFGYSCGGVYESYNIDKIVSELQEGYSVLLGGYAYKQETKSSNTGLTYTNGHEWLCHGLLELKTTKLYGCGNFFYFDGPESDWYLLCNWGWSGNHNGYFLSKAFDTNSKPAFSTDAGVRSTSEGTDHYYQYNLDEITGIRK